MEVSNRTESCVGTDDIHEQERQLADELMEKRETEARIKFWEYVESELSADEDYDKWMREMDDSLIESIERGDYMPPPLTIRDDSIIPY